MEAIECSTLHVRLTDVAGQWLRSAADGIRGDELPGTPLMLEAKPHFVDEARFFLRFFRGAV
ncbi:hypothetical protein [Pseudomonas sp. RL_105y_Pfl2_101]|uniref:hypothetical protein n=1 Tax=Pseudomonas sp. RL_105y_Pfl2_101 TaxID=3088708 RepID=UPI0030DCA157